VVTLRLIAPIVSSSLFSRPSGARIVKGVDMGGVVLEGDVISKIEIVMPSGAAKGSVRSFAAPLLN